MRGIVVCPTCLHPKVFVEDDTDDRGGRWECHSDKCAQLRAELAEDRASGRLYIYTKVPGGTRENPNLQYQRDSEVGMEEYREARAAGIKPGSIRKGATERWEQQVESQQRAIDKVEGVTDTSKLVTVDGVRK